LQLIAAARGHTDPVARLGVDPMILKNRQRGSTAGFLFGV